MHSVRQFYKYFFYISISFYFTFVSSVVDMFLILSLQLLLTYIFNDLQQGQYYNFQILPVIFIYRLKFMSKTLRKNHKQSPIKITLNHPVYRAINQNSRNKLELQGQKLNQQNQVSGAKSNRERHNSACIRNNFVYYINGQYFGKTSPKRQPNGSGIFIDDQFNFFLSSWKDGNKMHGLTFIKLINQITIYGSWINGQINGHNVIKRNNLQIFFETKGFKARNMASPILVMNSKAKVAYLLQIKSSLLNINQDTLDMKYQIINRQSYSHLNQIYSDLKSQCVNPNLIFNQSRTKVPQYMFSLPSFLQHLSYNKDDVLIKKLQEESEKYLFISIQESQKNLNLENHKKISHFRDLNIESQKLNKKDPKNIKLGLIYKFDNQSTKSIGNFDQHNRINGLGISFKKQSVMFGVFRQDMLTKQLYYNQNPSSKDLQKSKVKRKFTQEHMKSAHYKHDLIYFLQIKKMINFMNGVQDYIEAFQFQYVKRYQKAQESSGLSEQQVAFEQKYLGQYKINSSLKLEQTDFIRQKSKIDKKRPFGFIVNSKTPTRNIKRECSSRSPSQIDTLRLRHVSPYKAHQRNLRNYNEYKNLTIGTSNLSDTWIPQLQFNQQTSKNQNQNKMQGNLQILDKISTLKKYNQGNQQMIYTSRLKDPFNRIYNNSDLKIKQQKQPKRQLFWK